MAAFRCVHRIGDLKLFVRSLYLKPGSNCVGRRTFLSPSYACDHAWQKLQEDAVLKKINMGINKLWISDTKFGTFRSYADTYYVDLDQKFQSTKKISPIDLDLFAHCISNVGHLEELEDLLRRFRRIPVTNNVNGSPLLPSTSYAIVRSFLRFGQYEMLLKILHDRHNFGIFPDYYCYNLMMDTFVEQKNFRDATKISSLMMLQEEFDHPISKHLALYSCLSYLREPLPDKWLPEPVPPPPPEPDDIVIIRLNYLKPKYFDDHFDIKEPEKLIGKTIAMLGSHFQNEISRTCKIIGFALYGKWDKVKSHIEEYLQKHSAEIVYKECIDVINDIIEKIPDDDSGTRQTISTELKPLLDTLKAKTVDRDLVADVKKLVLENVSKHEASEAAQVSKQLTENWANGRIQLLEEQVQSYIRQMRIKKLEDMKEDLKKREQLLFFFENYEHNIQKAEEYDKVAAVVAEEAKKKDADKEYIPPETRQMHRFKVKK